MKARFIKTGEIVTVIAISTEHMTIQCYGNDGIKTYRRIRQNL